MPTFLEPAAAILICLPSGGGSPRCTLRGQLDTPIWKLEVLLRCR
jgi:hypothetical protein